MHTQVELKRRGRSARMDRTQRVSGQGADVGYLRTTIVLPLTLDSNLTLLCAQLGISKSEYIRQLLFADLIKHDLQPDKKPQKISVSY